MEEKLVINNKRQAASHNMLNDVAEKLKEPGANCIVYCLEEQTEYLKSQLHVILYGSGAKIHIPDNYTLVVQWNAESENPPPASRAHFHNSSHQELVNSARNRIAPDTYMDPLFIEKNYSFQLAQWRKYATSGLPIFNVAPSPVKTRGDVIRAARQDRGLSMGELARRMSIPVVLLNDFERDIIAPSEEQLMQLLVALFR